MSELPSCQICKRLRAEAYKADLLAGQKLLDLAEADQAEIERLEGALEEARAEVKGLTAEAQQWHGELEVVREDRAKLQRDKALLKEAIESIRRAQEET